jgi:hypothetical protein
MDSIIRAKRDEKLAARIVQRSPLIYADSDAADPDRPAHVRAASSLAPFREHLAVVQDDASYLAVVDPVHHSATSIALPASSSGDRVFDMERGNIHHKLDLEACVSVPGTDNGLLIALGSGSSDGREWIMLVDWRDGQKAPAVHVHHARALFDAMRACHEFSGAGLNIEGAVFADDDTLRLFQRGNFRPRDGLEPVDATADLSWAALQAHLQDPEGNAPPALANIVRYELGELRGTRLTFSDAERVGQAVLFSASAEAAGPQGEVAGSVLGVIDGGGARWTELADEDGAPFEGKIEGLCLDPRDPYRVWFVVDDDTPDEPSSIFEAALTGSWYPGEPE